VHLASNEEDYYGDGDASAMVFKPSMYFTIGYTTLTGTNREPEGGCPQGSASGQGIGWRCGGAEGETTEESPCPMWTPTWMKTTMAMAMATLWSAS